MHQCLKCGKQITDLSEIENGCSCGSQVFVYSKSHSDSPKARPEGKPGMSLIDFGKEMARKAAAKNPSAAPSKQVARVPSAQIPKDEEGILPGQPDGNSAEDEIQPAPKPGDSPPAAPSGEAEKSPPEEAEVPPRWDEIWLSKGASIQAASPEALENVRQLSKGVYEVDVNGLSGDGNPVVVKDEEGIYYVRLPFSEFSLPKRKGN